MKEKYTRYRRYITAFLFVAACIVIYKTIDNIDLILSGISIVFSVLTPFIIAFVLAFILYVPTGNVERLLKKTKKQFLFKHARGISVSSVYIALLLLLSVLLSFVIPPIIGSLVDLLSNLPDYYDNAIQYVKENISTDSKIFGNFDLSAFLDSITIQKFFEGFDLTQLKTYAQGVFAAGSAIVTFFIAVVVSVYMLLSRESLIATIKRVSSLFLSDNRKSILGTYLQRIGKIFYGYIYSQAFDSLIVGTFCVIAFSIAGMRYAVLMGILVGLANLIPYFGAIISGVGVVLLSLLTDNVFTAIIAAVIILVVQQVDGNFLQPRIVANKVGIQPLYVLFAITVGGGLFGVIGIYLGVPTMAVVRMLLNDYLDYREKKKGIHAAESKG